MSLQARYQSAVDDGDADKITQLLPLLNLEAAKTNLMAAETHLKAAQLTALARSNYLLKSLLINLKNISIMC